MKTSPFALGMHEPCIRHLYPNPARCTSTGRKCDGYDGFSHFQAFGPHQASGLPLAVPMLSGLGDSIHYLEFYHKYARPSLSSDFDKEFWSQTSLQMAQSEPAVRHALVALGYLHKTQSGSLKHARSSFAINHEHKTLLLYYNKAVRCLVDRMVESSYSPEIGLVTCVLFICIEFMRGNYETAFVHLSSGLNIITEWRKRQLNGLSNVPRLSPSFSANTSNRSGSSTIIEDKLIPIFIRAITAALLYGVPIEHIFQISGPLPMDLRKRPFLTILEAQSPNHELRNVSIVWIRNMAQKIFYGNVITTEDFKYQSYLLECHSAWLHCLQTLERHKHLSKEDKITASSLMVSYYGTYISVACAIETNQAKYDQHLENFKALNHHAKIVLNSMNPTTSSASSSITDSKSLPRSSSGKMPVSSPKTSQAANFTFEISVVPPLYFAATRCRCPVTRREAISLLLLNPPREALWDPKQHALVSERAIEIEESEVDPVTGWPVEKTRLWSVVVNGDMDGEGRFSVRFSAGSWFQGQVYGRNGEGRMWEEWFVM